MKRALILSASLLAVASVSVSACQPGDPGGFGRDRAAVIKSFQESDDAPGASGWGMIARERAGQNCQINREYREQNDQVPTHGNE